MTLYSGALFLHVLGALALFVALGLEWTGLGFMRRSSSLQEARQCFRVLMLPPKIYGPTLAFILLPGIYMAVVAWGNAAWINTAFAAVLVLVITGRVLTMPRMIAIGKALSAEDESLSAEIHERFNDRFIWKSLYVRVAMAVGIIFLMTFRPGIVGSLVAMVVAAGIGFAIGVPAWQPSVQPVESEAA